MKPYYTLIKQTNLRIMLGSNGKYGLFSYFSIEDTLVNIIPVDIYSERDIFLLINVDGASIHHNSKKYVWTILGLVHHHQYDAKSFLIGLYYGESKPMSANEFLQDFVQKLII